MSVAKSYSENRDYFAKLVDSRQMALQALVKRSGESRVSAAVKQLHQAWLRYYPAECELLGALSGGGGTWPSTHAVRCQANLMYRRYKRLGHVIRCIERAPQDAMAYFATQTCLYQLSPMTYGKES